MSIPVNPPPGHIRVVADLVVNVTDKLPPGSALPDWPQQLQDRVYKEMEMRGLARGRRWKHLRSSCGVEENVPFIHVVMYDDVPKQLYMPPKQTLQ